MTLLLLAAITQAATIAVEGEHVVLRDAGAWWRYAQDGALVGLGRDEAAPAGPPPYTPAPGGKVPIGTCTTPPLGAESVRVVSDATWAVVDAGELSFVVRRTDCRVEGPFDALKGTPLIVGERLWVGRGPAEVAVFDLPSMRPAWARTTRASRAELIPREGAAPLVLLGDRAIDPTTGTWWALPQDHRTMPGHGLVWGREGADTWVLHDITGALRARVAAPDLQKLKHTWAVADAAVASNGLQTVWLAGDGTTGVFEEGVEDPRGVPAIAARSPRRDPPAVDAVYGGDPNGLALRRTARGVVLWSAADGRDRGVDLRFDPTAGAVALGGRVVVVRVEDRLEAWAPATGARLWTRPIAATERVETAAIVYGPVARVDVEGGFELLDVVTGERVWGVRHGHLALTPGRVFDGLVIEAGGATHTLGAGPLAAPIPWVVATDRAPPLPDVGAPTRDPMAALSALRVARGANPFEEGPGDWTCAEIDARLASIDAVLPGLAAAVQAPYRAWCGPLATAVLPVPPVPSVAWGSAGRADPPPAPPRRPVKGPALVGLEGRGVLFQDQGPVPLPMFAGRATLVTVSSSVEALRRWGLPDTIDILVSSPVAYEAQMRIFWLGNTRSRYDGGAGVPSKKRVIYLDEDHTEEIRKTLDLQQDDTLLVSADGHELARGSLEEVAGAARGLALEGVEAPLPTKVLAPRFSWTSPVEIAGVTRLGGGGVLVRGQDVTARLDRDGRLAWRLDVALGSVESDPEAVVAASARGKGAVGLDLAAGRVLWRKGGVQVEASRRGRVVTRAADGGTRGQVLDARTGAPVRSLERAPTSADIDGVTLIGRYGALECTTDLETGVVSSCGPATKGTREVSVGDLTLAVQERVLVAKRAEAEVWRLAGIASVQAFDARRAIVTLGSIDGPQAIVGRDGRLAAWLPPYESIVVDAPLVWGRRGDRIEAVKP